MTMYRLLAHHSLQYEFSQRKASNRFLKATLTERMASWSRTDLSARARVTGKHDHRSRESIAGERFGTFKQLATAAKKDGSLIVGQLVMEKSGAFGKPHPATEEEIRDIIHRFVHVAVYLQKSVHDGRNPAEDRSPELFKTSPAGGVRMLRIAKDEEPIDLSNDANMEVFMKGPREWAQQMQKDGAAMNMYGYAQLPKG
ncbi:hypothetical protein LT330_008688 [Penicillium expansum]|nr:hypothetical protein LT330_008688 [Penicillium expansum]